jgi:hypothetical protein
MNTIFFLKEINENLQQTTSTTNNGNPWVTTWVLQQLHLHEWINKEHWRYWVQPLEEKPEKTHAFNEETPHESTITKFN